MAKRSMSIPNRLGRVVASASHELCRSSGAHEGRKSAIQTGAWTQPRSGRGIESCFCTGLYFAAARLLIFQLKPTADAVGYVLWLLRSSLPLSSQADLRFRPRETRFVSYLGRSREGAFGDDQEA